MRRKFFIPATFLLVFSMFVMASPIMASTVDDLMAQVNSLQAQINQLLVYVQSSQVQGGAVWCHNFDVNLEEGSSEEDVIALNTVLNKEVATNEIVANSSGWSNNNFNKSTASRVSMFQEKYASEILKPLGLKRGTGYVGNATRVKLNKLYGCGNSKACTEEAKLCPDGSYIGRIGPDCEFAQCPNSSACILEAKIGSIVNSVVNNINICK